MDGSRLPRYRDAYALGGWLFADLLLAVAIVFLAASPAGSYLAPSPSPTAAVSPGTSLAPTPSPTATPEPTMCVDAAILRKHELTVQPARAGRRASDAAIVDAFRSMRGQRVGLLLTFVHATTPAAGRESAREVNRMLRARFPSEVGASTITESYFSDVNGPIGTVSFIVYLTTRDCGT